MSEKSIRFKYPRTPHLPWSPGASLDDEHMDTCENFRDRNVVVTEKMDGENTTLYSDGLHARSLDSRHHASRDWVKAWHASIAHDIPQKWRICGENLYARHSIAYESLDSYFYLFSVWNSDNSCLCWDDTVEWAELLNCPYPKVLYRGLWNEKKLKEISIDSQTIEGYVVRLEDPFVYTDFSKSVAKWVRPNHVQTDQHWMHAQIIPNKLHD